MSCFPRKAAHEDTIHESIPQSQHLARVLRAGHLDLATSQFLDQRRDPDARMELPPHRKITLAHLGEEQPVDGVLLFDRRDETLSFLTVP